MKPEVRRCPTGNRRLLNSINVSARLLTGMLIVLFTGNGAVFAESPSVIEVGLFSTENAESGLPAHWEPLHFKGIKRHTEYRLIEEDGQVVVRAKADASASGLFREIAVDPGEYTTIRWRWKVADVLKKGNVHLKKGDDYPARVYILFEYDPGKAGFIETLKYETAKLFYGQYPPSASINYIWASNAQKGRVIPNPYTERAMMFVVESGKEMLNTWIDEERDLYADYREAFKGEPPMIRGVAIMTDTDNTGESVTAYYGDIVFLKKRQ